MGLAGRLICLLFLERASRAARQRLGGAALPVGTTCGWQCASDSRTQLYQTLRSRNKLFTARPIDHRLHLDRFRTNEWCLCTNPERGASRVWLVNVLLDHSRGSNGEHRLEHFGHVKSVAATWAIDARMCAARLGREGSGHATDERREPGPRRVWRSAGAAHAPRPEPAPRIDRHPHPPPPPEPDRLFFSPDRGTHLIFSVIFFPPSSSRRDPFAFITVSSLIYHRSGPEIFLQ